MHRKFRNWWGL